PQHLTPPALVSAHVWASAAAIAVTPLERPETSTGVSRSRRVPSPTAPPALKPQHLTPPALVSAHVWSPPAAIAVTPPERPETPTGVRRRRRVPSPSFPSPLPPQHTTPPAVVSAHVCWNPAEIAVTPSARPETPTGVRRRRRVPSPSCPSPLPPQH